MQKSLAEDKSSNKQSLSRPPSGRDIFKRNGKRKATLFQRKHSVSQPKNVAFKNLPNKKDMNKSIVIDPTALLNRMRTQVSILKKRKQTIYGIQGQMIANQEESERESNLINTGRNSVVTGEDLSIEILSRERSPELFKRSQDSKSRGFTRIIKMEKPIKEKEEKETRRKPVFSITTNNSYRNKSILQNMMPMEARNSYGRALFLKTRSTSKELKKPKNGLVNIFGSRKSISDVHRQDEYTPSQNQSLYKAGTLLSKKLSIIISPRLVIPFFLIFQEQKFKSKKSGKKPIQLKLIGSFNSQRSENFYIKRPSYRSKRKAKSFRKKIWDHAYQKEEQVGRVHKPLDKSVRKFIESSHNYLNSISGVERFSRGRRTGISLLKQNF